MATYTITVNERTKAGKSLVNYLKSLGVIEEPNDETLQASNETDCDYQQVQKRLGIGKTQKSPDSRTQ